LTRAVSLAVAPIEYGHYALAHPGSLPAVATVGWPAMWAWYPALGLMAIVLLLLFPTGQLPSRRGGAVPAGPPLHPAGG